MMGGACVRTRESGKGRKAQKVSVRSSSAVGKSKLLPGGRKDLWGGQGERFKQKKREGRRVGRRGGRTGQEEPVILRKKNKRNHQRLRRGQGLRGVPDGKKQILDR